MFFHKNYSCHFDSFIIKTKNKKEIEKEIETLHSFDYVLVCNVLFYYFSSVKPALKKVSKYENKFAKLQKKAAEFNFRNQLKVVKKKEFTLEEEEKEVSHIISHIYIYIYTSISIYTIVYTIFTHIYISDEIYKN